MPKILNEQTGKQLETNICKHIKKMFEDKKPLRYATCMNVVPAIMIALIEYEKLIDENDNQ